MNLTEQVAKINRILDEFGDAAIQVYDTGSFEAIGYKPQFLIDAINQVLGAGSWRHELHEYKLHEVKTKKGEDRTVVTVELSVQILAEDGTVVYSTGKQFGSGNVVFGNIGDGIKGAITDGIGKCFSLLSIGQKAYRGELDKPNRPTNKADADLKNDLFGSAPPPVVEKAAPTTLPVETAPQTEVVTPTAAPGGFRSKAPSNGNGKTEEKPQLSTTAAPTARFRSSGLASAFNQK